MIFHKHWKKKVFTLRFDKWRIKALRSNHCHVTACTTKIGKTQHDQKSKLQQNYSYFNRNLKTVLKLEVIPARVVCITHLSSCECCDTDILNKRKQFSGSAARFWGFDVWKLNVASVKTWSKCWLTVQCAYVALISEHIGDLLYLYKSLQFSPVSTFSVSEWQVHVNDNVSAEAKSEYRDKRFRSEHVSSSWPIYSLIVLWVSLTIISLSGDCFHHWNKYDWRRKCCFLAEALSI